MADTVIYDPASQQANSLLPFAMLSGGGFGGFGNGAWPLLFAMNGGGFGGFGGWGGAGLGGGILGFLLGALVGNNGGLGGIFGGGGNNAAAGFLSNQISGDSGRELIMNAINGTDADVRLLASTLNADVNEVRSAISAIQLGIQNVGSQVGMSGLQVQNAIQSGNASILSKLCECCCENRLLTTQQGYESRIQTIEQTNQLGSQADRNTAAITGAIADLKTTMTKEFCDARERDMQADINNKADIITQLRNEADNARQTQVFSQAFAALSQKISEIAAKQPNTVPVTWPNLAAVNMTPYVSGGYYQGGFNGLYGAPGFGGSINF